MPVCLGWPRARRGRIGPEQKAELLTGDGLRGSRDPEEQGASLSTWEGHRAPVHYHLRRPQERKRDGRSADSRAGKQQPWCDDVTAPELERCDELLGLALADGLREMAAAQGDEQGA
jgi:hypothetical protein